MSGLFGRSDPPAPPQLPPPPPKEEILDVLDEISGTQAITVTGPNGKKLRKITRLPRTEQEERFFKQGEELISGALTNLRTLYQSDPQSLVNFQPIVDAFSSINDERARDLSEIANLGNIEQDIQEFRTIQRNLLDDEIQRVNREQEEGLAQRGHLNSTAGNALRAQLAREELLARQQADLQARAFGENVANQRLNRNMNAFGLREAGRQGQIDAAERQFSLQQAQREQLENQRREQIQNNLSQLQVGSNITGQDINRAQSSSAPQLGLQQFALANQDNLNRYNANINRLNSNYQNQIAQYNARPPSFGETIARLGAGAAGSFFGGGLGGGFAGSLGRRAANSLFRNQREAS